MSSVRETTYPHSARPAQQAWRGRRSSRNCSWSRLVGRQDCQIAVSNALDTKSLPCVKSPMGLNWRHLFPSQQCDCFHWQVTDVQTGCTRCLLTSTSTSDWLPSYGGVSEEPHIWCKTLCHPNVLRARRRCIQLCPSLRRVRLLQAPHVHHSMLWLGVQGLPKRSWKE